MLVDNFVLESNIAAITGQEAGPDRYAFVMRSSEIEPPKLLTSSREGVPAPR